MVEKDAVSKDFRKQVLGYGLTTAEIVYRRPDRRWLLQTYVWQDACERHGIIYDYADMREPVLARMAAKRRVGYQAIGYKVLGTRDLFSDRAVTPNEPHRSRADR